MLLLFYVKSFAVKNHPHKMPAMRGTLTTRLLQQTRQSRINQNKNKPHPFRVKQPCGKSNIRKHKILNSWHKKRIPLWRDPFLGFNYLWD